MRGQVSAPPTEEPQFHERPGFQHKWLWNAGNPLKPDFWKDAGIRALQNLDFADRQTIRNVRQPLIEGFRPSTYQDAGTGNINPLTNLIPGRENEREAALGQLYTAFESQRGRAPNRMEQLDIQQDTTKWWAELLGELPFAALPIGSAKTVGSGLMRVGDDLLVEGAKRGGLAGRGMQAVGYGAQAASTPIVPLWAGEEALESAFRAGGRSLGRAGQRLAKARAPTPPPQLSALETEIESLRRIGERRRAMPDRGPQRVTNAPPQNLEGLVDAERQAVGAPGQIEQQITQPTPQTVQEPPPVRNIEEMVEQVRQEELTPPGRAQESEPVRNFEEMVEQVRREEPIQPGPAQEPQPIRNLDEVVEQVRREEPVQPGLTQAEPETIPAPVRNVADDQQHFYWYEPPEGGSPDTSGAEGPPGNLIAVPKGQSVPEGFASNRVNVATSVKNVWRKLGKGQQGLYLPKFQVSAVKLQVSLVASRGTPHLRRSRIGLNTTSKWKWWTWKTLGFCRPTTRSPLSRLPIIPHNCNRGRVELRR